MWGDDALLRRKLCFEVFFWDLVKILDLCGVMTHFFEGNCVLRIIFGSGYDQGPMWGDDTLLRRELCFEDLFFGSGYDLGPMWGDEALLRREMCFEDLFLDLD